MKCGYAAELDALNVPIDGIHGAVLHLRFAVHDPVALCRHDGHIAIGEVHYGTRVGHHGADVRCDDVFPVPDADQHRRAAPRHHDHPGIRFRDGRQTEGPLYAFQRRDDPLDKRGAARILNEMSQRFGVGIRDETMARPLEPNPERIGVLDDAVVHQGDGACAVQMRMGVAIGR